MDSRVGSPDVPVEVSKFPAASSDISRFSDLWWHKETSSFPFLAAQRVPKRDQNAHIGKKKKKKRNMSSTRKSQDLSPKSAFCVAPNTRSLVKHKKKVLLSWRWHQMLLQTRWSHCQPGLDRRFQGPGPMRIFSYPEKKKRFFLNGIW